jgi:hypothetical protein
VNDADTFRAAFAALEVSESFTEAVVDLRDSSCLQFTHRVNERKVHATGGGAAAELLVRIARFRLNAKHLDIQFQDGSRWEALLQSARQPSNSPGRLS